MKSLRSSPRFPCPVCGRSKDSDCAIDETAAGLKVRCHSFLEDEQIPGFVYRGRTACGTWGLYFEDRTALPKPKRPASKREFFYPDRKGFSLAKVLRIDDGEGNKKFSQWYWSRESKWEPGLPQEYQKRLHLYRIHEDINQRAIQNHDRLLVVEGEGKVDLLISMDIPATCGIGGAGKWRRYGYPNYLADLKGARIVLVPDRDKKGIAHMEDVAQDFPDVEWLYPFPDSPLWDRLPDKGGLDIADWIADFKLSKEQIMEVITKKKPTLPTLETTDSLIDRVRQIRSTGDAVDQWFAWQSLMKSSGYSKRELLELAVAVENRKPFAPLDVTEFIAKTPDSFPYLIDSLIVRGINMLVYSDSGVGKSLLLYDFCRSVATGKPWCSFGVDPGQVLILQTDEPSVVTKRRLKRMGFHDFPRDVCQIETSWQLGQIEQLDRWLQSAIRPRLVMIDCMATANRSSSLDENEMGYALAQNDLMHLADKYQVTIITLHHENKEGRSRGSTGLTAHTSDVWHLRRCQPAEEEQHQLTDNHRILEVRKSRSDFHGRHLLLFEPETYEWEYQGTLSTSETPKDSTVRSVILDFLKEHSGAWYEAGVIAFEVGKNLETVRKDLRQLADQQLIERDYQVNPKGGKPIPMYKISLTPPAISPIAKTLSEQELDGGGGVFPSVPPADRWGNGTPIAKPYPGEDSGGRGITAGDTPIFDRF